MPLPLTVLPLSRVSASLASEAGLGKARCPVWLRVAAPRSAPPYVSIGWEEPPDCELWRCQDFLLWLGQAFCLGPGSQVPELFVVPALLGAAWMALCSLENGSVVHFTALLVAVLGPRCSRSFRCSLRSRAARTETVLPQRCWLGGGAESHQRLEMWPGTTFPGVPLMLGCRGCMGRGFL